MNWVLEADISRFFDTIDHRRLMAVIRRRVVDRSLLRLIGKWLAVGVVEEDGRREDSRKGTPQGGVISPVLANIFLHEVYVGTSSLSAGSTIGPGWPGGGRCDAAARRLTGNA